MFSKNCPYSSIKIVKTIIYLLFINTVCLYSFDYTDFILNSNRNLNEHIYDMIEEEDLDDSIQIMKLIGLRDDPYVEDIIFNILNRRENINEFELLLENLLANVAEKDYEKKLFWLEQNKYGYFELIKQLDGFKSPYLKTYIVLLMENLNNLDINTYIMIEMQNILNKVEDSNGYLLPGDKILFFELLKIITGLDTGGFDEIILSILEETREEDIVKACRDSVINQ